MARTQEETKKKRDLESKVVTELIALYCQHKHGQLGKDDLGLCPSCRALDAYAQDRISHCPFMDSKTFCSNCKVHCYEPQKREEIRQVMRYAGPRLLFKRPLMVLHHMWLEFLEKRQL